jgi:hypothetical protein
MKLVTSCEACQKCHTLRNGNNMYVALAVYQLAGKKKFGKCERRAVLVLR